MDYLFYSALGYCVVSVTLFIFPLKSKINTRLLRVPEFQKYFQKKAIYHVSHRGGCRENLENTIEAFDHAIKQGTNCLEMDVCLTKDQKVVVIHDSYLQRMCGVSSCVENYEYSKLPPFMDRIRLDFAPNDYIQTTTCKTRYMPLLEDVFIRYPKTQINVELKTPTPELIRAVSNLAIKYNRENNLIWGAKKMKYSDALFAHNNKIPRFFSEQRVILIYGLYIIGLLPFVSIKEDSLQIPMYTTDFYRFKLSYAKNWREQISIWIFHTIIWGLNLISKPLFYHLGKRGILVIYWVLNNQQEYEQAFNSGCHGIMTDNPTSLKTYLQEKNKYVN